MEPRPAGAVSRTIHDRRHRDLAVADERSSAVDAACAVGEFFSLETDRTHQPHKEVGDRRTGLRCDMPAALQSTRVTGHQQRQIGTRVSVSVAQGAAVNYRRVIEQRAVSILSRFQALDESGQKLYVIAIDLRDLLDEIGMSPMVREWVVRIG